jgi:hypothetical protein
MTLLGFQKKVIFMCLLHYPIVFFFIFFAFKVPLSITTFTLSSRNQNKNDYHHLCIGVLFLQQSLAEKQDWIQKQLKDSGSGLWLTPSLFNHSCCPNTSWDQAGDFIFISTVRKIEAGEELFVTYVDVLKLFAERQESIQKWKFRCACERCSFNQYVFNLV